MTVGWETVASSVKRGVYEQKDQEERHVALFASSDGGIVIGLELFDASTLADV